MQKKKQRKKQKQQGTHLVREAKQAHNVRVLQPRQRRDLGGEVRKIARVEYDGEELLGGHRGGAVTGTVPAGAGERKRGGDFDVLAGKHAGK